MEVNRHYCRTVAVGLALAAVPALAVTNFNSNTAPSGAHYRNGSSEPVCMINQTTDTVSCTGTTIGGVGNTAATVSLRGDCHCQPHVHQ